MKNRRRHSQLSKRRGLTLIEVVASITLLSTLLAAMLVAFERHSRQIRRAQRTLAATAAADQWLAVWLQDPEGFPSEGSGGIPGSDFTWRTTPTPCSGPVSEHCRAVSFEIIDSTVVDPLVQVHVLLPALPKEQKS
jgi:prepilin-type N-terminal cleavage/methylation domain-containing protein